MTSPKFGEFYFRVIRYFSNELHRQLADADNKGKLNLAEFHVAMGLIYRSMSMYSFGGNTH